MSALWPPSSPPASSLLAALSYIRKTVHDMRKVEESQQKNLAKLAARLQKSASISPVINTDGKKEPKTKSAQLIYANSWPQWQEPVLQVLETCWDKVTQTLSIISFDA